ncbi:hypothetical protein [Edaphobacter aggregans]|nr:hypothetical protein [Edaphobacter aggregans]
MRDLYDIRFPASRISIYYTIGRIIDCTHLAKHQMSKEAAITE